MSTWITVTIANDLSKLFFRHVTDFDLILRESNLQNIFKNTVKRDWSQIHIP